MNNNIYTKQARRLWYENSRDDIIEEIAELYAYRDILLNEIEDINQLNTKLYFLLSVEIEE